MKACLTLAALMLALAAPAQATSFDCVALELPDRSITNQGVHRVQKKIKTWRDCYARQEAAGHVTADAQKLNAEVDADIQKWIDATRAVLRNPANAAVIAHIEHERARYLRSRHVR